MNNALRGQRKMKTQIGELVDNDETMFSTEGLTRLSTDDLKEKKLNIDAIHPYNKDGEDKVMFRFTLDDRDGVFYAFCGASNVVKKLSSERVLDAIAKGDTVEAVFYERPSQNDKKKTVYDLR